MNIKNQGVSWVYLCGTTELTDRRRKRAPAANPASDEPVRPNSKRGAAVRVQRSCSAFPVALVIAGAPPGAQRLECGKCRDLRSGEGRECCWT
jgi:hypothetical protein